MHKFAFVSLRHEQIAILATFVSILIAKDKGLYKSNQNSFKYEGHACIRPFITNSAVADVAAEPALSVL